MPIEKIDKQITIEALLQIENNQEENRFTNVVYQEDWHKGVIGIVASRLIETYYKPTLVFTKSGDKLAASARSVKDFDIYNALEASAEYLEQFGGHMYAAGMTLKEENYLLFKEKFEEVVKNSIPEHLRTPEITIDAEINLQDINEKFYRILNQFEPFGPLNMTPVFVSKNVFDTGYAKTLGKNDEHIKLFIKQDHSEGLSAVGFNLSKKMNTITDKKPFYMVFSIDQNEWNGVTNLQLKLRDIQ